MTNQDPEKFDKNLLLQALHNAANVYKNAQLDVKKNAGVLSYLKYDSSSLFSRLPLEYLVKIASLTGIEEQMIPEDKEFYNIALSEMGEVVGDISFEDLTQRYSK